VAPLGTPCIALRGWISAGAEAAAVCAESSGSACAIMVPTAAVLRTTVALSLLTSGAWGAGESDYWDSIAAEDEVFEEDVDHIWPNRYWEALHVRPSYLMPSPHKPLWSLRHPRRLIDTPRLTGWTPLLLPPLRRGTRAASRTTTGTASRWSSCPASASSTARPTSARGTALK
jgi:hypothetical protein